MVNRFRRILAVLLLLATVVSLSCAATAGSTTGFLNSDMYLRTSYDEDNYVALSISGNTLTASGKLRLDGLTKVMLTLEGQKQTVNASNGKEFSAQLGLSHNGTAALSIYTQKKPETTYWTFMWDRIIIEKTADGYRFAPSLTLEHNLTFVHASVEPANHKDASKVPASVKAQSDSIVAGVTDDYEKLFLLHKWVAENIYYDYDAYLTGQRTFYDPEEILANKRSVCEGYANLLHDMILAQGIPCIKSSTYALGLGTMGSFAVKADEAEKNTSNHAHVEAWAEGRWIILDATWDSNNKYENGSYNTTSPNGFYYFDITPEAFAMDHKYCDRGNVRYKNGDLIGQEFPSSVKVVRTAQKLNANGGELAPEVYNISGSNYFKLRDVAMLLNGTGSQFGVSYDSARKMIVVTTGAGYSPVGGELAAGEDKSSSARRSAQRLMINGRQTNLVAYNIGGNNFFKLRDLGTALGFHVGYDSATATMLVRSRA